MNTSKPNPRSPPPPVFSSTTAIIFSLILTGVFLHVYLQCLQKDFS